MKSANVPLASSLVLRRFVLLSLGVLLFGLGQFEQPIFAVLTQAWQAVFTGLGQAQWDAVTQPGLSTHSLPVALSYRLLYGSLNVVLLYLLLGGQRTLRLVSWCNAGVLGVGTLLIGLGQAAQLPLVSRQGHLLIDLVCSPLFLLLVWALLRLTSKPVAPSTPVLAAGATRLTSCSLPREAATPAATTSAA